MAIDEPPKDNQISERERDELRKLLPEVHLHYAIRRTQKTALYEASWRGKNVVVKRLLGDDPVWAEKFRQEIKVYRRFKMRRPPFRVPQLIDANEASGLLVLKHIDGRTVSPARHPAAPVEESDLTAVLATIARINAWRPPADEFDRVYDYASRIDRYHALGFLNDPERDVLLALVRSLKDFEWEFCHGDPLLSNFLRLNGTCAVVDWEFAGFYLPGFDLACMWMLLQEDLMARTTIAQTVEERGARYQAAYLVNLAMVYTRELRIYMEEPPSSERELQLLKLGQGWEDARRHLDSNPR